MAWWGKILGGGFGYLLGGPIGALFGVAMGHSLDSGIKSLNRGTQGNPEFGNQERIQGAFFTTTFSVMGHIAKADGHVTEREIQLARSIMSHMLLNSEQKKVAIRLFTQGKKYDFPLSSVLNQFKQECQGRRNLIQMFLEIQCQAAYADGEMHEEEKRLLLIISSQLGFSHKQFEHIDEMVRAQIDYAGFSTGQTNQPPSISDAYAVLGVDVNAKQAEIKRAYRRLMNQYHPDKLVSRGLPEEMTKIATEKTHEIRAAYDQIRKAHDF